jgi:glucose-1-phosphate cytidylyltransferase
MKTVILAGGFGTRMAEETQVLPKPMLQIGGMPILWHLMKSYSAAGLNEFVICCGYKGYLIKEFFANYPLHMSDVTIDMASGSLEVHNRRSEPWKVTLVDTGDGTMTGGRLLRVRQFVEADDAFCFTYGDGLADVDIAAQVSFHRSHGRLATITAVQPPGRYGALRLEGDRVAAFIEKPQGDGGAINGGFFVLSPKVLDLIDGDQTTWEEEPLTHLATSGELMAYTHTGFWQAMDTPRDRRQLEELWSSGNAPWKTW